MTPPEVVLNQTWNENEVVPVPVVGMGKTLSGSLRYSPAVRLKAWPTLPAAKVAGRTRVPGLLPALSRLLPSPFHQSTKPDTDANACVVAMPASALLAIVTTTS